MYSCTAIPRRPQFVRATLHRYSTFDSAGHRLTFVRFAQAPHFSHLAALDNSFDSCPLDFVRNAAVLSKGVK
jgi:hypothetical protein